MSEWLRFEWKAEWLESTRTRRPNDCVSNRYFAVLLFLLLAYTIMNVQWKEHDSRIIPCLKRDLRDRQIDSTNEENWRFASPATAIQLASILLHSSRKRENVSAVYRARRKVAGMHLLSSSVSAVGELSQFYYGNVPASELLNSISMLLCFVAFVLYLLWTPVRSVLKPWRFVIVIQLQSFIKDIFFLG